MPRTNSNFDRLKDVVGEMIAVETREKQPPREHIYDGAVLIEIRERGKTTTTVSCRHSFDRAGRFNR